MMHMPVKVITVEREYGSHGAEFAHDSTVARHRRFPAHDRAAVRRPQKSIRALEEVMKADKPILLATQQNAADDDPATDAIFTTGTLARVLQLLKLPDGTVKVLVEGRRSGKISDTCPPRILCGRGGGDRRRSDRGDRGRSAVALGALGIRELRQAQQEDFAGGGRGGHPDRRLRQARGHDRLASGGQACGQAGNSGNPFDRQAIRKVLGADGERNLGACRSRSASARASSARWRRRSANIISTSR